ncbi:Casein kinase II, regulatory subunit [Metarhizium album ARSEF 1941]|uniref:Casein kinase II, regulatory subunit n=1 Tax=Metarhizium album (strain ARSEF 1941) TaxID=1081103 RepID=A0A0B2X7B3_METAS|nr:Casein kinase II, regulatory subunit [Metarhizium album ARSEF 1941]KHO01653.1 Casein kinase II, regulatory subunit [Metarhizium album ARSEF 1941]
MEQIETQASDLRYLAQAPAALSDTASVSYDTPRPGPHASPSGSASYGDNSAAVAASASASTASKRKSMGDGDGAAQKQTRSKRNRRCGNLNLACLYAPNCCSNNFKDSDEFKSVTSQLRRLQEEVSRLNQTMKALQAESTRLVAPPTDRGLNGGPGSTLAPSPVLSSTSTSMPRPDLTHAKVGAFRGTTSMAYSLDVANTTIANMGYHGMDDTDHQDHQGSDVAIQVTATNAGLDPLVEFGKDEMVRLCRFHEDEIGIMYPVLNIHSVIAHAKNIAPFLDSLRRQPQPSELINDDKTLQLKMVMCCALVTESHGHSDRAIRLYESMEGVVNKKLMSDRSDVANLPVLCLLAGYRFLSCDEVLAWRVIGQVVRLCLEAGIHQTRGLTRIRDDVERRNALNSFWSAYVLDRRWAFGTGLPYSVQDDEIDPTLPLPDEYPFLVAMITYSRLGAKVWRQVSHFGPVLARELRQEEIDSLDREILQWYEKVPDEVKIRIWLYTPILHSATSIMQHPGQAQRVVDLAKDTIQYLNHLNGTTNLYRRSQTFYHQFLASAISVVFLASVHAPVRFSAVCREEFYLALDLVKDLSAKSWVSKRLWRTIKSLKDVAPRFGLNPDDDAHSSAALGMIGLARGHLDASPVTQSQSPFPSLAMPASHHVPEQPVEKNGRLIQSELSRIFEGYVGLNGFHFGDERVAPHNNLGTSDSAAGIFTPDGTVFPHLRDMF